MKKDGNIKEKIMDNFVLIQNNHYGKLHNGKTIFFSHIDHLRETFYDISKVDNKVALITANGDEPICQYYVHNCPPNVEYWFAHNHLAPRKNTFSIPIGLDNSFENVRPKHGNGWDHAIEKIPLLTDIFLNGNTVPSKFMLGNFYTGTFPPHRNRVRDVCVETPHIDYIYPITSYREYIYKMLEYEAIVCPGGNGMDSHRLWETLYCKRIPVTIEIKHQNQWNWRFYPSQDNRYEIYRQLYSELPIVILDSEEELRDENHMRNLIDVQKRKEFNKNILNYMYWEEKVLNCEKSIINGNV